MFVEQEGNESLLASPSDEIPLWRRNGLSGSHRLFGNKYLAVHPTVTLSIVDHYTRVAKDTNKRVVGVLLGEYLEGKTHATTSFAVPFEEDMRDPSLWYLDHNYLESMTYMFGKINKRERIVGWYSTGNRIKPADLEINELFRRYTPHPIYLLVNVLPQGAGDDLPFSAYMSHDVPSSDNTFRKSFTHIASGVAQLEAEEVAVEHLLRDLQRLSFSTRGTMLADRINGLKCLSQKLDDIVLYLEEVGEGRLPLHPRIVNNLQNMFNLMPNHNKPEIIDAFDAEINTSMLAIYVGSAVRCVLALQNLVKNRLETKLNPKGCSQKGARVTEEQKGTVKNEGPASKNGGRDKDT